jgi:hypothetical protein
VVDKVHLRGDSLAGADLAKVIDRRSVGSWLGSRSRHVADCLYVAISAPQHGEMYSRLPELFVKDHGGGLRCRTKDTAVGTGRSRDSGPLRRDGIETFAHTQTIVGHRDRAWASSPPHRCECFR